MLCYSTLSYFEFFLIILGYSILTYLSYLR
jgi:hypothetical protein